MMEKLTFFEARGRPNWPVKSSGLHPASAPIGFSWLWTKSPPVPDKLNQGKADEQQTFSGHIWRLMNEETNVVKAILLR